MTADGQFAHGPAGAVKYEQRRAYRHSTRHPSLLLNPDGSILTPCMMKNVSAAGAKLEFQTPCDIPEKFTLLLSKYGNVSRKCVVLWRSKKSAGVRFVVV